MFKIISVITLYVVSQFSLAEIGSSFVLAQSGMVPEGMKIPDVDALDEVAHRDDIAGFAFKNLYSAYFFQSKHNYENPALGYSLEYASITRTKITVYVYDLGRKGITDGVESAFVQQELAKAVGALEAEVGRGTYASVTVMPEANKFSPYFLQASHNVAHKRGGQFKSYTLVRAQNGFFIKIRASAVSSGMEGRFYMFINQLATDLGVE